MKSIILAATVALLASTCNAAVMAPPRDIIQSDSAGMNQMTSCAYNEGMMLIDPSEVHVWLSSPVLSGNTWLSELPADLRAELFRVNPELDSVAVMCVKPSQAHAVDHVIEQIEQMKMMSDYGSDGVNFSSADSDQFDSDFTSSDDIYADDDDFGTQQVWGARGGAVAVRGPRGGAVAWRGGAIGFGRGIGVGGVRRGGAIGWRRGGRVY